MSRIQVLKRFDHAIPRLDKMTVDDMLILLRTKFRFVDIEMVDWLETDDEKGIWQEDHMKWIVRLSHVGYSSDDLCVWGPDNGTLHATLAETVRQAKDAA